jgi:UDP:flavonoid glycosyltransferase YjiC (YdhE family)
MNALILPLGSMGDVHPFVGLGRVLQRRGHEVTVAANQRFESLVRQAGLEFVEVGTREELESAFCQPGFWHPWACFKAVVHRLVLPAMRRQYAVIQERCRSRDTVVIASTMGLGARIAHDKLGLPLVSVHLQPMVIWSEFRSPVVGPLWLSDKVPRLFRRAQYRSVEALTVKRWILRRANDFRAELALPPLGTMTELLHSPQRVIAMFPEWFAPRQPDWPAQMQQTGFALWDESELSGPSPEVEAFLGAGEPPVVFTLSSTAWRAREFYAAAAGACRILGCRGLLVAPEPAAVPSELPAGVRWFSHVPFRRLLPRARALVHHAGLGTGALALAAGVPQIVRPCSFDQPDNAARLRRLGVAEKMRVAEVNAKSLARTLERVLGSAEIRQRVAEMAARLEPSTALEQAGDIVEEALRAARTLSRNAAN